MTDFTEVLEKTYNITFRRDLVDVTKDAVKSETLKLHLIDFFPKDHFEIGVEFSESLAVQQYEYAATIPRLRQLDYIRKVTVDSSAAGFTAGNFFQIITPAQALDRYNTQKENVAYQSGLAINLRSSEAFTNVLVGCFRYPDTTEATYSSWIADETIELVALSAAYRVLLLTGERRAAAIQADIQQFWLPALLANIGTTSAV